MNCSSTQFCGANAQSSLPCLVPGRSGKSASLSRISPPALSEVERAPCFGRSTQDVFEGKAREICGPGGKILIPPIKSMRFLSLDGAGMRGLYTASYLSWLVEGFAKKRGVPHLDPGKAFDLIAGTSTGANCRLCHLEWDLLGYRCKALSIRGQGHLPPHERCGNEITATMLSAGAPLRSASRPSEYGAILRCRAGSKPIPGLA